MKNCQKSKSWKIRFAKWNLRILWLWFDFKNTFFTISMSKLGNIMSLRQQAICCPLVTFEFWQWNFSGRLIHYLAKSKHHLIEDKVDYLSKKSSKLDFIKRFEHRCFLIAICLKCFNSSIWKLPASFLFQFSRTLWWNFCWVILDWALMKGWLHFLDKLIASFQIIWWYQ